MITVNWSPRSLVDKTQPTKATTILDFEPVKITSLIGKDSVYAKCPAFIDYTKNTFALLAPFDIDIKTEEQYRDFLSSSESRSLVEQLFSTDNEDETSLDELPGFDARTIKLLENGGVFSVEDRSFLTFCPTLRSWLE